MAPASKELRAPLLGDRLKNLTKTRNLWGVGDAGELESWRAGEPAPA